VPVIITVAGKTNGRTSVRPLGDDALNEAQYPFDFDELFLLFFFVAITLLPGVGCPARSEFEPDRPYPAKSWCITNERRMNGPTVQRWQPSQADQRLTLRTAARRGCTAYITNNGSSNAISASGACLMDVVPVTTGMDQLARHSSALGTITTCWRKAADQAAIVRESRSKFRKMTHNPFQRETNE
jgi:hypothetical protein